MKRIVAVVALIGCLGVTACSPTTVFAPDVLAGVDPHFDFSRWRALPNQTVDKKVQLGGRILQADRRDGTVTLVLMQLPIVEHPAFGPKDTGKRSGEFAVTFNGSIERPFLQSGNRVLLVGTTQPAQIVSVDDTPRSFPTVAAKCLHIWNTGGREISDFPSYGAGYETLEEDTFCAAHQ